MKLEFEDNDYYLVDDNNDTIATTDKIFLKVDGVVNKLSRENCNEIFGKGDVEIVTEPYVKYVSRSLETIYPPLGIRNKLDKDGCVILKNI